MNVSILVDSIRANDDLTTIANVVGISIDDLKAFLIDSIQENSSSEMEDQSDNGDSKVDTEEEYDTDSEEDHYDRIIRKAPIPFSDEQIEFMRLAVKERLNLALLAAAGYGKSSVVETTIELFENTLEPHTIDWFSKRYGRFANIEELICCPTVGLAASTGKAASLIKGRTLHSYLGIGVGRGTVADWVKRVTTAKYLRATFNNLRAVQVILIDEISMISAQLLDKISEYLQKIRRNDKPFGGIQMIFIGDLAQLNPVSGVFMFKSKEYKAAKVRTHVLTKCFRQSDPAFLKILNEIRFGNCSDESFKILQSKKSIDEEVSGNLKPMRILATNAEVDRVNDYELRDVCEKSGLTPIAFPVKYVSSDTKKADAFRKMDMIPDSVKLVVGAQIVITHNISKTVVNGSQGVVVSIHSNEVGVELLGIGKVVIPYIDYKDPDHNDIYSAKALFQYLPMKLSWASTIHKVQGMTLHLLEVDLSRVFCHGQAYVAISRVKSLQGLIVKGLKSKASFICDPAVKAFYGVE